MNILEKDIEDLIWSGLQFNQGVLENTGFPILRDATYRRQVRLGNYGIAD